MLGAMTQACLRTQWIGDQSPRSLPIPVTGFASNLEGLVHASAYGGLAFVPLLVEGLLSCLYLWRACFRASTCGGLAFVCI